MAPGTATRSLITLAALLVASPAVADLTADEVWVTWKNQTTGGGAQSLVIGAEESSAGAVTIRDLALTLQEDEITAETVIPALSFIEQADGTVLVTLPERITFDISSSGDDFAFSIAFDQQDQRIIASGDPDAMSYRITAARQELSLISLLVEDEDVPGEVRVTMNAVDIIQAISGEDLLDVTYGGAIDSLDLLVDFPSLDRDGSGAIAAGARIDMISFDASGSVPQDMTPQSTAALFGAGFAFSGGYEIAGMEFVADIQADGEGFAVSGSHGPASLSQDMGATRLTYDTSFTDLDLRFQGAQFPLPVMVTLAESGLGFEMPVAATKTFEDLRLSLDLVGLAVDDALWDLFDAGQRLPRDPLTFQLALSGKARALIDLFDPEEQADLPPGTPPLEVSELSLDRLNIDALGLQVTGAGSFALDNNDLESFAPLPRPEGRLEVQINGLNQLLDTVVAMGLIPEAELMAPRMMMGMFARSTGPDQMETTLEVLPNGQVTVNGNRVR